MPSLISIGMYSFSDTKINHEISFGQSLTTIKDYAFFRCASIPLISFSSKNNINIGINAFQNCSSINSLTFNCQDSVILGDYSFSGLSSLKTLNIPNYITQIGTYCFSLCGLNHVCFENNIISQSFIPTGMFRDCSSLYNIFIPSNTKVINGEAFYNTKIEIVYIPNTLTELGRQCFKNCRYLREINITDDSELASISYGVFDGCYSFAKISNFQSKNFKTDYGALYDKDMTKMIVYPPNSPSVFFALAYTVKSIAESAFIGCVNLQSVLIPDNTVTMIGMSAFEGCFNLKHINIPMSVKYIGSNAFLGCARLDYGSIIVENRTISYRDMLLEAGVNKKALLSCEFITCRSSYYFMNYVQFQVFILI